MHQKENSEEEMARGGIEMATWWIGMIIILWIILVLWIILADRG